MQIYQKIDNIQFMILPCSAFTANCLFSQTLTDFIKWLLLLPRCLS